MSFVLGIKVGPVEDVGFLGSVLLTKNVEAHNFEVFPGRQQS